MKYIFLKLLKDEKGQSTVEYLLMVIFVGLTAIAIAKAFPVAIRAYIGRIYALLSYPIP